MLGTGQQHVLEHDTARGYYVVGNGLNPTVAELTEAALSQPELREPFRPTKRLGND